MRSYALVPSAAIILAAISPLAVPAQFKDPAPDELRMTAEPKAPGADAIYLYREETTDDALHYHSYLERIKVLTEKGKEVATVRIPYEKGPFKVTDIRGRTIHADGTIVPLTAKPSDLVDVKAKGAQLNTMVFTLPSVEVGSILEYSLQIRYDDNIVSEPTWQVQQPYFVRKAHYHFTPNKSGGITNSRGELLTRLMYMIHYDGSSNVMRDATGNYTFDAADIPPIPREDWMPPLNALTYKVEFYYTQYQTGDQFWKEEGKRWLKEVDHFTNPTKTLQEAVSQIAGPGDSEQQKAQKIYDAVMKLDNTAFSREKSDAERKKEKLKNIKSAEDVWNQKGGSEDDIARLYIALARAAGLKVYPMQVVNRNRAILDRDYLTTYQLDDYIAIVELGGKEIFVDPGQKACPFGLLHWKHTLAGGIRGTANGPAFAGTPAATYKENSRERAADLMLDDDKNITGMVRYILSGQDALHWRQVALENDAEEVKKQFKESVRPDLPDGIEMEFDHFAGLDASGGNLVAALKVTGNIGTQTGKRFFMPGQFFEAHGKHPFVAQDKRTIPVDVLYPRLEADEVIYRLPSGLKVENAPQADGASWPDYAMMKVASEIRPDRVRISRLVAYNYTLLDPKEYAQLHDFYQKVATVDQQLLILTSISTPVKGN
jgi:Domain of Unknown Function with PDB structure (DUF3857)/Transglutaminase-like superfamily